MGSQASGSAGSTRICWHPPGSRGSSCERSTSDSEGKRSASESALRPIDPGARRSYGRIAFGSTGRSDYGYASAITVIIFMILIVITAFQFRFTNMMEERSKNV